MPRSYITLRYSTITANPNANADAMPSTRSSCQGDGSPQSPSIDDDDVTDPDKGGCDLDDAKAKMPPAPEGRLPDLSSIPGMEDFKMDPTSE